MHSNEERAPNSDVPIGWITGISDGLTLPFALITGLSRVTESSSIIIKISIVFILFSAIILSISSYLARVKISDTDMTYKDIGLSQETERALMQEQMDDHDRWLTELKENEILPSDYGRAPFYTGLSYTIGGAMSLMPYSFLNVAEAFRLSCLASVIALFVFGWLKATYTGKNIWAGAFRSAATGCAIAVCVYIVAGFFSQ